jgi:prevent-host-death family protein
MRSMADVSVHEAKTHLSRLLRRVELGEEIVICRGGTPVARLVPSIAPKKKRILGMDDGKVEIPDDFDDDLPEELLRLFNGEEEE